MIQALLSGRKAQTRRTSGLKDINQNPGKWDFVRTEVRADGNLYAVFVNRDTYKSKFIRCPYGKPGDMLYSRETFYEAGKNAQSHPEDDEWGVWCGLGEYHFAANGLPKVKEKNDWNMEPGTSGKNGFIPYKDDYFWRKMSSMFMPKSIARIWVQNEGIRCERLRDISEEDAVAEGVEQNPDGSWHDYLKPESLWQDDAVASFYSLAILLNGNKVLETNPWLFVMSFRIISTTGKPDNLE